MNTPPDIQPPDAAAPARSYQRLVKAGVSTGIVLFVIALVLALPQQWKGNMAYLNLDGVSMQPTLYAGDLAVVRKADSYKVGDIVAYEPTGSRGSFYLHRIREVTPDGYIFRGDNNEDDDPRVVRKEQLIGSMIFHIPKAGLLIGNRLFLFAVVGAIMLLTFGVSMLPAKWQPKALFGRARQGARDCIVSIKGPQPIKWGFFAVALMLLATAGAIKYSAEPEAAQKKVRSHLSYSADAKVSEAYPDGQIKSGDTVYTKLAHELDLEWKLTAAQASGLKLFIKDGQDWKREVELDGAWSSGVWKARIDLDEIVDLTDKVRKQTGVPNSTYTLQFKPSGLSKGTPAIPAVDFLLNDGVLRPSTKSSLKWSPNVTDGPARDNTGLWTVMLVAAALGFIILGAMENQPIPVARRVALGNAPVGDWIDMDSPEEIEKFAIKMDMPIMEHFTGLYVIASGMNWGYRYMPQLSGLESEHEVA